MQTEEFIARVKQECPELDADVTHQATLTTLETLCEQLPAEQTRRMASQLPDELTRAAEAGGDRADTSDVPIILSEFHSKLMFRTELSEETTKQLARSVARSLHEAVTNAEMSDVVLELPPELDQLLTA